jgi:hypothetical protein
MKTFVKDTNEAPNKWWAFQDARMRNIKNKSHWGDGVKLKVEQMKMVLDCLYAGSIYEAYGKKSVSIKIDKPRVKDRIDLALMEAEWACQGITKTETAQGILYRVA